MQLTKDYRVLKRHSLPHNIIVIRKLRWIHPQAFLLEPEVNVRPEADRIATSEAYMNFWRNIRYSNLYFLWKLKFSFKQIIIFFEKNYISSLKSNNLILLQHHCRKCGKAICDYCSSKRSTLTDRGHEYPVNFSHFFVTIVFSSIFSLTGDTSIR